MVWLKLFHLLMPLIAVATVAVLCGNAIAQSASVSLKSGGQVVLAVSLLHASGFFFGYLLSRMLCIDVSSSWTILIEVAMQNSLLGVVLAGESSYHRSMRSFQLLSLNLWKSLGEFGDVQPRLPSASTYDAAHVKPVRSILCRNAR